MAPPRVEPPGGAKPPEPEPAKAKKSSSKGHDKAEGKAKKASSKSKSERSSGSKSSSADTPAAAEGSSKRSSSKRSKPASDGFSRSEPATAAASMTPAAPVAPEAGRTLARTLSFCGGEAVAEALHKDLARGVLYLVQDEEDPAGGLTLQSPGVIAREERGGAGGSPRSPLGGSGSGRLPRPTVMGDSCHATLSLYPVLTGVESNQQRCGLLEAVVDAGPTRRLEKAAAINWHPDCPYLVALKTESDGNCLCHAASLGTWGVHDRKLLLRQAVRSLLVDDRQRAVRLMRRAWERELGRHGVTLEKEDLDLEWHTLARQAEETSPAGGGAMDGGNGGYAYLEAAHVYALAHVLRRPIVVFATDWVNAQGKTLAHAEEIAGIYLPYALPRRFLTRTPLLLAFDNFHFSPLVPMDPSKSARVPLVQGAKAKGSLLPLPFFFPSPDSFSTSTTTKPPTQEEMLAVLHQYLDCERLADGTLAVKVDPDPTAPEGLASVLLGNVMAAAGGRMPNTTTRRHSSTMTLGAASRSSSSSSLASWLTPIGAKPEGALPKKEAASAAATSSASSVGSSSSSGSAATAGIGRLYRTSGDASASSYTPPRNLHTLGSLKRQQTPEQAAANAAAIAAWSSGIRRRDSGTGLASGASSVASGGGCKSRRRGRPEGEEEAAKGMAKSASWCCPPSAVPPGALPTRKITVERTSSATDLSTSGTGTAGAGAGSTAAAPDAAPEHTRVLAHAYEDDACTGAGRAREDVFTALARAVKEAAAQSKQAALDTSNSLSKKAAGAGTALRNPRALLAGGVEGVAGISAGLKGLMVSVAAKGKGGASGAAAEGVVESKEEEPPLSAAAAPVPEQQPATERGKEKKEKKKRDKDKDKDKDKGKNKEGKGDKKEKKERKEKGSSKKSKGKEQAAEQQQEAAVVVADAARAEHVVTVPAPVEEAVAPAVET